MFTILIWSEDLDGPIATDHRSSDAVHSVAIGEPSWRRRLYEAQNGQDVLLICLELYDIPKDLIHLRISIWLIFVDIHTIPDYLLIFVDICWYLLIYWYLFLEISVRIYWRYVLTQHFLFPLGRFASKISGEYDKRRVMFRCCKMQLGIDIVHVCIMCTKHVLYRYYCILSMDTFAHIKYILNT